MDDIKTGDIWYSTGGYEQTTIKWYRVMRTTKTMIVLEKLSGKVTENPELFMQGVSEPVIDSGSGREDIRRKVHRNGYGPMISIDNYSMGATAYPWDGKPKRCSWYA